MAKTPTPIRKTPPQSRSHTVKSTSQIKTTPKTSSVSKKSAPSSAKSISIATAPPPPLPIISDEAIIHRKGHLEHYAYVDLTPRFDAFRDHQDTNDKWRIHIGDYVCIQVQNDQGISYPPGLMKKSHPFNVQWRPCQILSIYRERPSTIKSRSDALKVEVRWFYRSSDLDTRHRESEKLNKSGKDEILESGHVAITDASLLLGKLDLRHDANADEGETPTVVPLVKNTCSRFYLHKEKDILYLFDGMSMLTRGLGYSQQLQQNEELRKKVYNHLNLPVPENESSHGNYKEQHTLSLPPHSLHIKYTTGEKIFYPSCILTYPWSMLNHKSLICPLEQRRNFPKWNLCVGDVIAVPCESSQPSMGVDNISGRDKWYPYFQPWSHAQVIAIYRTVKKSDLSNQKEMNSVFASEVQLRIRWFNRLSEAMSETIDAKKLEKLQKMAEDADRTAEVLLEGKELTEINCELILGPVRIDADSTISPRKNGHVSSCEDTSPVSMFMVQNLRVLGSNLSKETMLRRGLDACDLFTSKQKKQTYQDSILEARQERAMEIITVAGLGVSSATKRKKVPDSSKSVNGLESGVGVSGKKNLPEKRRLFEEKSPAKHNSDHHKTPRKSGATKDSVKPNLEDNNVSYDKHLQTYSIPQAETFDGEDQRVTCRKKPFHVDVSSLKSFYEEIEIKPPLDSYDNTFLSKIKMSQNRKPWVVSMGDTVTLEVESSEKIGFATHYPFNVSWGPVEIVSIYQVHKNKDSALKLREAIQDSKDNTLETHPSDSTNDIRLEVRWLYRSNEIPGGKSTSPKNSRNDLEEVFETDHLDFCTADSILSPLVIHEKQQTADLSDTVHGLPCIHYYCNRFWSLHRKSFVPSGSHSSRAERGRMHSGFFGKHGTAKAALSRLKGQITDIDNETAVVDRVTSWQDAFQAAIKTLSLAEAAQDVQLHGSKLACRDKERKKISDFLRAAICGGQMRLLGSDNEISMATKNYLYIAGPPGTGKTASVRSVIRELQEDQSRGQVPEFKYIELNGMEMRTPYDAYVKFWEAISGIKKESLTPQHAAARLDNYFLETDEDYDDLDGEVTRKPVTVLLLDEIDYLVTEKETVLYSFFDWPLRAVVGAKLVVVGISNTLNLPQRLSPKLSSRMGQDSMYFGAYNKDEIVTIIKKRLDMTGDICNDIFETDAIRFAAMKTSNRSGDIRKAFQICKLAAERVYEAVTSGEGKSKNEPRPIVRTEDVAKASKDMFHSTIYKAISCSTSYQAVLLIALGGLMKLGREDGRFSVQDVRAKMVSISDASGDERYLQVNWLDFSDVLYMVTRLGEAGIVQMRYPNLTNPFPLIATSLDPYEICNCFKNTPHAPLANKHLVDQMEF